MDNLNDTRKGKIEANNPTGITYLAVFFFILKPPSRTEGFDGGMAAEKTSSPPHAGMA
jgi:hypothetical protein